MTQENAHSRVVKNSKKHFQFLAIVISKKFWSYLSEAEVAAMLAAAEKKPKQDVEFPFESFILEDYSYCSFEFRSSYFGVPKRF